MYTPPKLHYGQGNVVNLYFCYSSQYIVKLWHVNIVTIATALKCNM